ncbi:uncharacterized protein LOC111714070 [Eurytemora carolleeae]|uniref:uncharacterized protein LOC111714070 n=1 Tax=Eurytemora carolleeae TaxID=1294199 RepID=UPI000C760018|nr:uncharacterized protein LOC111714070 [Eurytemora carolleeae]|eukprot:XP_023344856.1 uncharacterized protein LOC111714070 [Eurytemora affinis]
MFQKEQGWKLPLNELELGTKELDCLSNDKVYWPEDNKCYDLLSSGPCSSGEWLVLDVEVRDGDCQCKVALAAAQDGICEPGEQLLLDPFGFGVCGCITSPPHATWPNDGKCYPLYTRGPCDEGYQLTMSPSRLEPSCSPSLCGDERSVLYEDGECYFLGTKGPCAEVEILSIHEETFQPYCKIVLSQVKRVFDMLPGGFIKNGPISINLKARNCQLNTDGKCKDAFVPAQQISRKSPNRPAIRQRASKSYIGWLQSFRTT